MSKRQGAVGEEERSDCESGAGENAYPDTANGTETQG